MKHLKLIRQMERLDAPGEKYVEWVAADEDARLYATHAQTLAPERVDFYEETDARPELWKALEARMPGVYVEPIPDIRRVGAALADAKAQAATEAGRFTFNGQEFATTERSQRLLMGSWSMRDMPIYPLTWPTADDDGFEVVADLAQFTAFYLAAFAQIRAYQEVGVWAKQQIALCGTVDEILAVLATAWP